MRRPLDTIDLRILAVLQKHGRITKVDLAAEVGLSPSPCWERMRKLERAGYITAYRAEVDLHRIVRHEAFFVEVTLAGHSASDFQRFEGAIQKIPEIVECHAVGGGVDYVLRVICADVEKYQALIDGLLEADIGIGRYFTYIVTKPVKPFRGYPIERLAPAEVSAAG